jgi:Bacteriophage probable baseplate hub protein
MAATAHAILRDSRPTIAVGGKDSPELAEGLLDLVVEDTADGLARCEARFGNWGSTGSAAGFLYFDRATLDFGRALEIRYGGGTLFQGRITALEAEFPEGAPPALCALAEDRLQDLRMVRRTASYANVSDADVVRQVASKHGLTPAVNLTGPTHRVLAQLNQSDLAFLRDRCRAVDAELWLDGTTLRAAPRTSRAGAPLQLTIGRELRSFTVVADLAGQRSAVAVTGWDVAGKSAIRFEATEAAVRPELDGGDGGATVLGAALGDRKESLVHAVPLTAAEAQARAEAAYRLLARRFLVGRGVADTDPGLRVGATVDLRNLGPLFSGKYYVAEVRHLFDGVAGLRTELVAERAGLGRP